MWDHADTGIKQKMHDFWLVGGGVREALEITTLMEQGVMTDLKHWQKVGPGYDLMIPRARPSVDDHGRPAFQCQGAHQRVG
jgi:hypothetical protein